ncbi:MAG: phage tail assembly protein [Thalassobaculaceae bacterium]
MAKTVTLSKAIEAHGKQVTELTFNEPTLAVLEDLELHFTDGGVKLKLGAVIGAIAAMADIPPSSAKQIPLSDLMAIAAELKDFLPPSLLTGGT